MSLNGSAQGMRRYLYEYFFHQTVERTKELTGKPLMISQVRRLRDQVEEKLRAQGTSMQAPDLRVSPVLNAIEDTMIENVPGYSPRFGDRTVESPGYKILTGRFMSMAGLTPEGAGKPGPRLPISPYDPRFATRSTVKQAGSELLYVDEATIETEAGGQVRDLDKMVGEGLVFSRIDPQHETLREAGPMMSLDDASGMTELMGRMSERDYAQVRQWVIDGARTEDGRYNVSRYMSEEGMSRSRAILDELANQGVDYRVVRDQNPGQIKAVIEGSKVSVRLTDTRENEVYVGRVHEDGINTYFSTDIAAGRNTNRTARFTPSAADVVALMRYAQGHPVERIDGKGQVGQPRVRQQRSWRSGSQKTTAMNDVYTSGSSLSTVYGRAKVGEQTGNVRIRRDASSRSTAAEHFGDAEKAESFLRGAVESARDRLRWELDVEGLIVQAEDNMEAAQNGEYEPELSPNADVAAIQRGYWDVLVGRRDVLLRPDEPMLDEADEAAVTDLELEPFTDRVDDLSYHGSTPVEKVRRHQEVLIDDMVGTYDLRISETDRIRARNEGASMDDVAPKRFDPVRVAQYMESSYGTWRNNDDIVFALRASGVPAEDLRGTNYYNDRVKSRMIKFDEHTARSKEQITDPFLQRMVGEVESSLGRNGVTVRDVKMDEAGVIRWRGLRATKTSGAPEEFTGEIGQIFAPGEYGAVTTQFAGGANYMFVPGYEARILPQVPGEDKSVEERTVLRGYEQIMAEEIRHRIATDVLSSRAEVGEPASLNNTYRRLYDTRHPEDFIERSAQEGLDESWRKAILETEGRRVRYSNAVRDGSTINAEYQASKGRGELDPSNDNFFDAHVLTGGRNMSILTEHGDGYFDPMMTSGSINQGVTRYITEGAVVGEDGRITPSSADDRAPLMKHPDTAMMQHDPFDRQQMSTANLMKAAAVTEPTRTAMATFGGWTADDPVVVSQRFASEHKIYGADGQLRELVPGDKISDLHGNKGVISLIIDPSMSMEEAREQNLAEEVAWFKANDVDVVMSPFSAVSRFNGGTARELMGTKEEDLQRIRELVAQGLDPLEADPELADRVQGSDLQHVDSEGRSTGATRGAIGDMRFIVTHMAVDDKTKIYDDEALAQGRGRKASSQLAWALGAQGCESIMAEAYGSNAGSVANLREMLVTMGLDMDPEGTLRVGSDPMADDDRHLFEMPSLKITDTGRLNTKEMLREFGDVVDTRGGDLELPFALKMPSGALTPQASDSTWKLPVLSSHLRTGQDLADGTSTAHDYTNHYRTIFEMSLKYRFAKSKLQEADLPAKDRQRHEQTVASAPGQAQAAYDLITNSLKNRQFSGKRNVFKEQIMANRMPNSATAVWTSDPRLAIDEVAMGPAMAEKLSLAEGDHTLIWRDPMLRDAGVRYMKVTLDERLTGVAINPVMDKCFDGDFDGDAVAVVKLNTKAAQREAMEKLSVPANLLDLGQRDENGMYPLAMQDSLDVKVAQHRNPELKERFEELTVRANDVYEEYVTGVTDREGLLKENRVLTSELSDYYRDALSGEFGGAVLSFNDVQSHLQSVKEACIDTGAKGSLGKLSSYARHLGAEMEIDESGKVIAEDKRVPLIDRTDAEGVMYATAIKSFGTGVAGTFSQRGVKALRNDQLKAVLELTYPVTQSILQAKHDPEEARIKYENLMGPARDIWRGRLLEKQVEPDGHTTWSPVKDGNGGYVQAPAETWKEQFIDLYTSPEGLNVSINTDHVDAVKEALTDPQSGEIINIEDPKNQRGSTMDKLAYGGDFSTVLTAAAERENLFDGSQNGHFAPFQVRENQAKVAEYEHQLEEKGMSASVDLPELAPLVKKDTQVDGRARGSQKRSPMSRTPRTPRRDEGAGYALLNDHVYEDVDSKQGRHLDGMDV